MEENKRSHLWKDQASCGHRFSEPVSSTLSQDLSVQSDEKCSSARSRLPNITSAKADSVDIPDDEHWEDSVFRENWHSVKGGKTFFHQRSLSVPAKLPDVVQEASFHLGRWSPDILVKNRGNDNCLKCWCGQKRSMNTFHFNNSDTELDAVAESRHGTGEMPDSTGLHTFPDVDEKKKKFEGIVFYEKISSTAESTRRKKSVTFEDLSRTDVQKLEVSVEGQKRRRRFRSSGYGSLSDGSHTSQASSHSTVSEQESIILEEPMEQRPSLNNIPLNIPFVDDENDSSSDQPGTYNDTMFTLVNVDGSIHGSDEADRFVQEGSVEDMAANVHGKSNEDQYLDQCARGQKGKTHVFPHEGLNMEVTPPCLWRPDSTCISELPKLSIFASENSAGPESIDPPGEAKTCTASESTANHNDEKCFSVSASENNSDFVGHLPFGQEHPSTESARSFSFKESEEAEISQYQTKFSPKTNEECQREFFERMFMEKMQNFDPDKEDFAELLDWLRNNFADVLSPSPRSPFFPAEISPQTIKQMVPSGLLKDLGITAPPGIDARLAASGGPAQASTTLPTAQPRPLMDLSQATVESSKSEPLMGLSQATVESSKPEPSSESFFLLDPEDAESSRFAVQPCAAMQQTLPAVVPKFTLERNSMSLSTGRYLSGSSFGTGVGSSSMEYIVNCSQCSDNSCDNVACIQLRKSITNLKEAIRNKQKLSKENEQVLNLLHQHYKDCDLPNCRVTWCRLISRWCKQRRKTVKEVILSSLMTPFNTSHTFIPPWVEFSRKFVKLDVGLPWMSMPQEGKDWFVQNLLSHTHSVVRVSLLNSSSVKRCQDWVLKITWLHDTNNQIEVLECLRELRKSDAVKVIVNHLWAAADRGNDLLLVCTEYVSGITLKEHLTQKRRLRCQRAAYFFLQILSATEYLHNKQIVYLCWDSTNFIIERRSHRIKMTNFTSSVCLSGEEADIGAVKLSLPADIIPPELFVPGGKLGIGSDSWGMGCLLHEMLTGFRPWYNLRHCSPQEIGPKIGKQLSSKLSLDVPDHAQQLLKDCWERSPEQRPVLNEMSFCIQRYFENCQNDCRR